MERRRNLLAFWLLGLINNSVYVIMLAGAKVGRLVGEEEDPCWLQKRVVLVPVVSTYYYDYGMGTEIYPIQAPLT